MDFSLVMFTVVRLLAIAAGVVLVWLAVRHYRRSRRDPGRTLRSLPGETVQQIADRLDTPEELLGFFETFFGSAYQGSEEAVADPGSLRKRLPAELPDDEFADLVRTADAIEPDALLAYACALPERKVPAVITICRGNRTRWLVGVWRPENGD